MRQVVFRKCIKKSSSLSHKKCEEVSLQIEFTTLPPKNHNLFVKLERKRNWRNKEMRPQANNTRYNTQGEIWVGGEGVGGSFVPTYIWAGWNGMTIHILFNSIKKGLLLTAIQIRGTAETRRCGADAVRLQMITWNPLLTLCASYLPLPPPPQLRPLFSESLLIVTLVNPAHGTQGCPKIISFDKNHWHFNF